MRESHEEAYAHGAIYAMSHLRASRLNAQTSVTYNENAQVLLLRHFIT